MPKPIVIDLSHHNVIQKDLKQAAASGIIGVIHKATEGTTYKDAKAAAREFLARDAGMLFGLYHFLRSSDIDEQVMNFINVYNGFDPKNLLIALDYEDDDVGLDKALEWLQKVQKQTGKVPVIYSGHTLKDKLGGERHPQLNQDNYPLWLAQYTTGDPSLPIGWSTYWLWQYTDKGSVPGVTPPTDLNAGDIDQVVGLWHEDDAPIPEPGRMDFADAMRVVLDGERARRSGWNGKGMWIGVRAVRVEGDELRAAVCMYTAQGTLVPWLASVTDMMACDWETVD